MVFGGAAAILRAVVEDVSIAPLRRRARSRRRGLVGPAVVGLIAAALALGGAGCIEPNRARGGADGVVSPDASGDTATPDGPDADAGAVACGPGAPCEQPEGACRAADCVDGVCVERARTDEACDDGDPCTGAGACDAAGRCAPGEARPEGSECAPASACAEASTCDGDGVCRAGDTSCPDPGRPCLTAVCDAHAGCVDVAVSDGTPCDGGADGDGGVCARGVCVPAGMALVPAGEFVMGCDGTFCPLDQRPSHRVGLRAFAVDVRELTNAQYAACVADATTGGPRCPPRPVGPGEVGDAVVADAAELAAARLPWAAAKAACAYYGKRLCTEAEWERAARGADERAFPWGDAPSPSCERAVMSDGAGGRGCGLGHQAAPGTRPLGASPHGLLDASGNVAEWVADHYHPDAYEQRAADDVTFDPVMSEPHLTYPLARVLRGGGWRDTAAPNLRATARRPQLVSAVDDAAGVRCCFTPDGDDADGDDVGGGER